MEAPEMNHVQGQEAIVRQYEDLIRRMQQQHAMEMEQLMMQMQGQMKGPSPDTMQESVGTMPPMQMGGGFGLPFAQEGGEREPSIFNTDEAKSKITNASASQRQFLNDGLDMVKQSMLSQQGATAGATGPRPGGGSGLGPVDDGTGGSFPYRRSPEERQMDKDARQNERQERRDLRGGNNMGGRERRPARRRASSASLGVRKCWR